MEMAAFDTFRSCGHDDLITKSIILGAQVMLMGSKFTIKMTK